MPRTTSDRITAANPVRVTGGSAVPASMATGAAGVRVIGTSAVPASMATGAAGVRVIGTSAVPESMAAAARTRTGRADAQTRRAPGARIGAAQTQH